MTEINSSILRKHYEQLTTFIPLWRDWYRSSFSLSKSKSSMATGESTIESKVSNNSRKGHYKSHIQQYNSEHHHYYNSRRIILDNLHDKVVQQPVRSIMMEAGITGCQNDDLYRYKGDPQKTCKWIRFKKECRELYCQDPEVHQL